MCLLNPYVPDGQLLHLNEVGAGLHNLNLCLQVRGQQLNVPAEMRCLILRST